LIKSLFWAGLCKEEAKLDSRGIDFEIKKIKVRIKSYKTRIVPIINDDFLNDLKHQIGKTNQGYVLCDNNNQALVDT